MYPMGKSNILLRVDESMFIHKVKLLAQHCLCVFF